jgi:hypothetical protein
MNQRQRALGANQSTALVGHLFLALVLSLSLSGAAAQSWTPTGAPSTNWIALATASDGAKVFAAVGGFASPAGPILISTNSGLTWAQSSAPVTNWTQVACSADGSVVHAAAKTGIYTSTNHGATWQPASLSPSIDGVWLSLACSTDGKTILAANDFAGTNLFVTEAFVSTNLGVTWTSDILDQDYMVSAALSADGAQMVGSVVISVGGGQGPGMVTSTNKGLTWVDSSAPFWSESLASSADGRTLAGAPGVITISTNSGATWKLSGGGLGLAVACSANGSRMVGVGPRGIWVSSDVGKSWSQASLPSYLTNWNAVASSADGYKIYASLNGGGIYTFQANPSPVLGITGSDSDLTFSWIIPSLPFQLEQTPDVTSGNWKLVPVTPSLNYSTLEYQVSIPKPQGTMFYRLASQ